nr:hypothetical protein Iba_chr02dCG4360 [Ipomoea batatas]
MGTLCLCGWALCLYGNGHPVPLWLGFMPLCSQFPFPFVSLSLVSLTSRRKQINGKTEQRRTSGGVDPGEAALGSFPSLSPSSLSMAVSGRDCNNSSDGIHLFPRFSSPFGNGFDNLPVTVMASGGCRRPRRVGQGVLPSCDEAAASSLSLPSSERRERSNGHGSPFVDDNRRAGLAARRCLSCVFGDASKPVINGVAAEGGRSQFPFPFVSLSLVSLTSRRKQINGKTEQRRTSGGVDPGEAALGSFPSLSPSSLSTAVSGRDCNNSSDGIHLFPRFSSPFGNGFDNLPVTVMASGGCRRPRRVGQGVLPSCDEAAASSPSLPSSERRERSNGHGSPFVDDNRRAGLAARRCLSCVFGDASKPVINGVAAEGGRWLLPPALHGRDVG